MSRTPSGWTTLERSDALVELMVALARHDEDGERIPCSNPLRAHWWLSDDPAHVEAAIHECLTRCPAFKACESYVTKHGEVAGVWAGTTPAQRSHS